MAATRWLYETGPVTGSELELPNVDEGVVVARDLVEFLRTFREADGRKYWE